MELKTYRAKSLYEALQIVRHELGPDAAVLHTRELRRGWLGGRRQYEVTASADVHVPSRFSPPAAEPPAAAVVPTPPATADAEHPQNDLQNDLQEQIADLQSMVEELQRQSNEPRREAFPQVFLDLFTELLDAAIPEDDARELVERVRRAAAPNEHRDPLWVRARLSRMVEDEVPCAGPIQVAAGRTRVIAVVGPTGVGKTTTIAKLAANFQLREDCRVGLITVDTYRIAAVDQLRTYADIIDLPLEVVSTPGEMRAAVSRLGTLDLILVDTAGRSPRDEVRIQELKQLLAEAQADEVHLALSGVASLPSLRQAWTQFEDAGIQSVMLTKLDESAGALGNWFPFLRQCRLPVSYVTYGQNVPDDIALAAPRPLARAILGHRDPQIFATHRLSE